MQKRPAPRVRARLLVLLWIWALLVFAVLDLFLNVSGLDSVRPRAPLYRGMRVAAHRMVGEPLPDAGGGSFAPVAKRRGDTLLAVAHDADETAKARKQAARLIGRTGLGADDRLLDLIDSRLPASVRTGAILGLGESGTAAATERLLALAPEIYAVEALALVANPEAGPQLRQAALDPRFTAKTRRAICRALARLPDPATTRVLIDVLRNGATDAEVRAAAARSLGRLGDAGALPALSATCAGADPEIWRQARLASSRLLHSSPTTRSPSRSSPSRSPR